jgi:hypothetical protein
VANLHRIDLAPRGIGPLLLRGRLLALATLLALWPTLASAQIAFIAPTAPPADNGDRIANTQWVNNFLSVLPLPSGKIWIGSAGNVATPQTPSGDCTLSLAGVVTCTKTNNVVFAPSATTDTTNANNISSGTLPIARGGTNDSGTSWTTYTPTITSQGGAPGATTPTGRWKSIGKTVFVEISVTITSAGTATGLLFATLPVTAVTGPIQAMAGVESAVSGKSCKSFIASGDTRAGISFYDNTTVWAASNVVTTQGVYESN